MEFVRADHEVSEGIRGAHGARTYLCSSLGYREGSIAPVKGGPRAGHGALGSGEAGPEPAGSGRGPHVPASTPRRAAPPLAASPPSLAHTYGARVGERARAASGGALGAGRVRHRRRRAGRALCAWGGVCGRGGGRGAAAGAPCVGRRGMSRPAQPRECCGGLEPTARADVRYGGPRAAVAAAPAPAPFLRTTINAPADAFWRARILERQAGALNELSEGEHALGPSAAARPSHPRATNRAHKH